MFSQLSEPRFCDIRLLGGAARGGSADCLDPAKDRPRLKALERCPPPHGDWCKRLLQGNFAQVYKIVLKLKQGILTIN
jgi:hypothetical protein